METERFGISSGVFCVGVRQPGRSMGRWRPRRRHRYGYTVLTAASLVLAAGAACSDDGAEEARATATSVSTTTTTSAPAGPLPACKTATLEGRLAGREQAMNQPSFSFSLTNTEEPCSLNGYPTVSILDAAGRVVRGPASHGPGFIVDDVGPSEIRLDTGAKAYFALSTLTICTGEPPDAPVAATVQISAPGDPGTLTVPADVSYCPEGVFAVTALSTKDPLAPG